MHRHTVVVGTITTGAKGDVFILPKRAHPNISKDAGNMIRLSISFGASNKTSKFEDQCMFGSVITEGAKI